LATFQGSDHRIALQVDGSPKTKSNIPLSSSAFINVLVRDHLLEQNMRIRVFGSTTFESVRSRIQSAHIERGLRLLPSNFQKLTIGGVEYDDNSNLFEVLRGLEGDTPTIVVEPRVPELVSFFLSGVCDLRNQFNPVEWRVREERSDSEHVCMVGDLEDLIFDDDQLTCIDSVKSPESCVSSTLSPSLTPKSRESPTQPFITRLNTELEALYSAQATPINPSRPIAFRKLSKSFDEREAMELLLSESMSAKPASSGPALMRAVLMREVSVPEEMYVSHLHLLVRNMEDAQPFLKSFQRQWSETAELVMTVQSGLRHGHTPQQGARRQFNYGKLVDHCCGGTYIMSDSSGRPCAVFKPADEEPYAPLNPKVDCQLFHFPESDFFIRCLSKC
jgi:hypothetical protein